MKTIMVHIESDDGQEARLQTAFDLARAFGGHLACVQVTPYAAYSLGEPGMGAFPIKALVDAIETERRDERAIVELRLKVEGVSWDWISRDGDTVDRLAEVARLTDVVVVSSGPFADSASIRIGVAGDIAIHAPAPVIAVPPGSRGIAVTGAALVAWNGSQEAAVAMRAALPMLRLAETVDILTIDEPAGEFSAQAAAAYLSRQGVSAEIIARHSGTEGVEAVIRAVLVERRSAWLMHGAYGHSRLRETLFGGVTRGLLSDAPVPLVMAH